MYELSSFVPWLVLMKIQVHMLRNAKGSLRLEKNSLQIAANVKIVKKAQKQGQRNL